MHLSLDANGVLYSREQLLNAAAEIQLREGFSVEVSDRLIADWTELGLLDRPVKRGLGRGKGIVAGWPETQLQLWMVLVRKRREVTRIADLCNLPVALWMYFGEQYVPLRQVKLALSTWVGTHGKIGSWAEARASSRRFLDQLGDVHLKSRRRKQVIDLMANACYNGFSKPEDVESFRSDFLRQTNPHPGGSRLPMNAESGASLISARFVAYCQLPTVPDHLYGWARVFLLQSLKSYEHERQHPIEGEIDWSGFEPKNFEQLLSHACLDLWTQPRGRSTSFRRRWSRRRMSRGCSFQMATVRLLASTLV